MSALAGLLVIILVVIGFMIICKCKGKKEGLTLPNDSQVTVNDALQQISNLVDQAKNAPNAAVVQEDLQQASTRLQALADAIKANVNSKYQALLPQIDAAKKTLDDAKTKLENAKDMITVESIRRGDLANIQAIVVSLKNNVSGAVTDVAAVVTPAVNYIVATPAYVAATRYVDDWRARRRPWYPYGGGYNGSPDMSPSNPPGTTPSRTGEGFHY